MTTDKHQINETHIGTDVTADQAREVVRNLNRLGYPSEYNGMQGVASYLTDEDGERVDIPQSVWDEALSTLTDRAAD